MELALAVAWPALDCSEETKRDADWAIEPPVVLGAEEDASEEAEPDVADAPDVEAEPEQPAAVGCTNGQSLFNAFWSAIFPLGKL